MSATQEDTSTPTAVPPRSSPNAPSRPVILAGKRYAVLERIEGLPHETLARAYDAKLQREVVLRDIHVDATDGSADERRSRIVTVVSAWAKLAHPNVIDIYDIGDPELADSDPNPVRLVAEHVPGTTLKLWLAEERSWREIVERFVGAGRALATAHDVGIAGFGFDPATVLVNATTTKVSDVARGSVGSVEGAVDERRHDRRTFALELQRALRPDTSNHRGTEPCPRPIADIVLRGIHDDDSSIAEFVQALERRCKRGTRHAHSWMLGVAVCAAGVAAFDIHAQASASRRCMGADEKMGASWKDDIRERTHTAFTGVQATYAVDAWIRTEAALDAYAAAWISTHNEACEATAVRKEQSEAMMDLKIACLHRAKIGFDAAVAVLSRADATVVSQAHQVVAGLPPVARCADDAAVSSEVDPPRPQDAPAVEEIRDVLAEARALRHAGRYADASVSIDRAATILASIRYRPIEIEVLIVRGMMLEGIGEYTDANTSFTRASRLAAAARLPNFLLEAMTGSMGMLGRLERIEEGVRLSEVAVGLAGDDVLGQASVFESLGNLQLFAGRYEAALNLHRRSLELRERRLQPDHPDLYRARAILAVDLRRLGRVAEAVVEQQRVLTTLEESLGPQHPHVAGTLGNLANLHHDAGDHALAEAERRRSLELYARALGEQHPATITAMNNLAISLASQGKFDRAEELSRRVLALQEKVSGPEHSTVAAAVHNVACALQDQGRHAEALPYLRRSVALHTKFFGAYHLETATSRNSLGKALTATGDLEGAEAEFRAVLRGRTEALAPDHVELADTRLALAHVLVRRGQLPEARTLAELAWERNGDADMAAQVLGQNALVLAEILWAGARTRTQRVHARSLAERARAAFSSVGPQHRRLLQEARTWLASHRV